MSGRCMSSCIAALICHRKRGAFGVNAVPHIGRMHDGLQARSSALQACRDMAQPPFMPYTVTTHRSIIDHGFCDIAAEVNWQHHAAHRRAFTQLMQWGRSLVY